MLTKQQSDAIDLLILGEQNRTDIAKVVGCNRKTLYDWMGKNAEFKAEWERRLHECETIGRQEFKRKLDIVLQEWWITMMSKDCEKRTKAQLMINWVDRALGKPSTAIEISDKREDSSIDSGEIDQLFYEDQES